MYYAPYKVFRFIKGYALGSTGLSATTSAIAHDWSKIWNGTPNNDWVVGLTTTDQYYIAEILPISSSPNAINDMQCFDLSRSSTQFEMLCVLILHLDQKLWMLNVIRDFNKYVLLQEKLHVLDWEGAKSHHEITPKWFRTFSINCYRCRIIRWALGVC